MPCFISSWGSHGAGPDVNYTLGINWYKAFLSSIVCTPTSVQGLLEAETARQGSDSLPSACLPLAATEGRGLWDLQSPSLRTLGPGDPLLFAPFPACASLLQPFSPAAGRKEVQVGLSDGKWHLFEGGKTFPFKTGHPRGTPSVWAARMVASLSPAPQSALAGQSLPLHGCKPVLSPTPPGRASVCPCSTSLLRQSPRFSKENGLWFPSSLFPPWIQPDELLKSEAGGLLPEDRYYVLGNEDYSSECCRFVPFLS